MDEQQIQDIADRVIDALHDLAPGESPWWAWLPALTPLAAFTAAVVAAVIGWRNLKAQQRALKVTVKSNARNLRQKRDADARSEWWRRTQWALDASISENRVMKEYGLAMLDIQANSILAGPEEARLLKVTLSDSLIATSDSSIRLLLQDATGIDPVQFPPPPPLSDSGPVDAAPGEGENEASKGGKP